MTADHASSLGLIDEMVSDPYLTAPEAFSVHDDASANWVVRKIVEARAYAKQCGDWCAAEQARARRDEEYLLFRFGQQLLDHARRRIAELGGRRKSVSLPAGLIGFRQDAPKLVIDDEPP